MASRRRSTEAGNGPVLGRYQLVERLAVGGSAEVWRGHDERLDRPVAVKRLHPHLLPDGSSRQRLADEARAAAGLSHPAIVSIYDVDADGEAPLLVMELVEGESLAARLDRGGPLPARKAVLIAAEISEGLFHAHQRGIVHRDVKPGNILLEPNGRARLVDFGIARSLAESAARLTMTGTVTGTLRYMAPEQLRGETVGPRCDLYGLGIVLHEALTGRTPYLAASPLALAEQQHAGVPPMEGVDPALAALIAACLAVDLDRRPLHAGALAAALRAWLEGRPQTAFAPTAAGLGSATDAITLPVPVPVPVARADSAGQPSVLRRPRWAAAVLVAAALAGAFTLGMLLPRDQGIEAVGPSPPSTPSLTAAPVATPIPAVSAPEWVEELTDRYRDKCGEQGLAEFEQVIMSMNKKAAEQHGEALFDDCEGAQED